MDHFTETKNESGLGLSLRSMSDYQNITSFPDKFISKLTDEEDYICGGSLILIGIVAVIGNGGSIFMFWKRSKTLTPAELLLFNLALANLLLAGCSYPANMVTFLVHRWVLGEAGCKIYGFVVYLLGIANIMSVAALAVVRYCKTCTMSLATAISVGKVKIIICGIYLFSTFWSILPLFGFGDYEVEPFGTSCTLDWANPSQSGQLYIALSVLLIVAIPLLVMSFCYIQILLLVHKNNLRRKKFDKKFRQQSSKSPSEFQLTMISFLVCIGFMTAWMPYAFVSVYYGMVQKRFPPIYVSLIPVLLAKSSCAFNPIIYVFVTARYRKDFGILIWNLFGLRKCCRHVRKNHDDDSSTMMRRDNLTLSLDFNNQSEMNAKVKVAKNIFEITNTESEKLKTDDESKLQQKVVLENNGKLDEKDIILKDFSLNIKSSVEGETISGVTRLKTNSNQVSCV